jgi:hypothetical protein
MIAGVMCRVSKNAAHVQDAQPNRGDPSNVNSKLADSAVPINNFGHNRTSKVFPRRLQRYRKIFALQYIGGRYRPQI